MGSLTRSSGPMTSLGASMMYRSSAAWRLTFGSGWFFSMLLYSSMLSCSLPQACRCQAVSSAASGQVQS